MTDAKGYPLEALRRLRAGEEDSAARALVEGRLDLRLRKPSDEPADREPLDAKDLEKWDLYDELVERLPLDLLQDNSAAEAAKREGIQIKLYAIIYELIDQVKEAMAGLLDPLLKEVPVGQAEVRKVFDLSKGGKVAGCYVASGKLLRGKMRVRRKTHIIYEGVSLTLKRFQDEVNEVRAGMECGVRLEGFDEYAEGDFIECYTVEKIAQKL
jgi:hypothetical protein